MVADDTELERHALTILFNAVSPIRAEGRTELRYGAKNSQPIQRSARLLRRAFFLGTKECDTTLQLGSQIFLRCYDVHGFAGFTP